MGHSWGQCSDTGLVYLIAGSNSHLTILYSKAAGRMNLAFAESTRRSYTAMFKIFLAFLNFIDIHPLSISSNHILAFLEFLVYNRVSHSQISNYLSATKANYSMLALDTSPFYDQRIKYFTRAVARCAPLTVKLKTIVEPPLLIQIIQQCEHLYMGYVVKAAILLAYFAFLRISNLVPHTINSYEPLKQLARADIFFAPPGAHVLLKWSKTMQMNNSVRVIKIPALGASPLCPVAALQHLLHNTPHQPNSPLFQIKCYAKWVPLTDTRLRKNFSTILNNLNLTQSKITFHSLRRSGATLAFNSSVPIQDIQSHGTWTSECVWSYITQDHQASDNVALAFKQLLQP